MTTVPFAMLWMLVFGQVVVQAQLAVPAVRLVPALVAPIDAAGSRDALVPAPVDEKVAPRVFRAQRRIALRDLGTLDAKLTVVGKDNGQLETTNDGLSLKVTPGAGRFAAIGFTLNTPLESDFQITVGYELLSVDQPTAGAGAGVSLEIATSPKTADAPSTAAQATLSRVVATDGRALYSIEQLVPPEKGSAVPQRQTAAATGQKGRLRIQRAGGLLRYQATLNDSDKGESDKGETDRFADLAQLAFTSDPVAQLKLVAQNGNSNAAVQVRLFDLVLESDRITEVGPSTQLIDGTQIAGRPTVADGQHLIYETETGQRSIAFDEVATVKLGTDAATPKLDTPTTADAAKPGESTPFVVQLDGDDHVAGELLEITEDTLRLKSPHGELSLPLAAMRGLRLAAAKPEEQASIDRAMGSPTNLDMLFVRSKEGQLADIKGTITGLSGGKLKVDYEGEVRSISQARLVGLVLAARPPVNPSLEPYQIVWLGSNERLSGKLVTLSDAHCEFRVAAHRPSKDAVAACKISQQSISQITFHNGRTIYLSDVDPVTVEETGYFGRGVPYRRDQNLAGGVLAIGSRPFAKGLAVQARTVLVYQLDAPFEQFRATLGFDPAAGSAGRVRCRVLGDGRELFVVDDLQAVADPIEVVAPLSGIRRLALEVDFGVNEDVGDRLIWGDARIERKTDKTADSASR